ncbi:hypothetical protein ACRCPS_17365 [Pseudomonas aeruginosa]
MRTTFAALAILSLSASAFAADKQEINLPALSALPIKLSTPYTPGAGEARLFGRITAWGMLNEDAGSFVKILDKNTELLAERKCAINFAAKQSDTGRVIPTDRKAAIACPRADGSLIVADVEGYLVDKTGKPGMEQAKYGDEAYYVLNSQVRIPLSAQ